MGLFDQQTIHYRTFIKTALVKALRDVFIAHPDTNLATKQTNGVTTAGTKVGIEYPTDRLHYPTVIVKFYEREIKNVGISNLEVVGGTTYEHYWYTGDIELVLMALDPRSLDYMANTVVQTITTGTLTAWTNGFFHDIYELMDTDNPDWASNIINVNSDIISGFGDSRESAPWGPEDAFIYKTSYRVGAMGEYYSVPATQAILQAINAVNIYPYDSSVGEAVPSGTADSAPWRTY